MARRSSGNLAYRRTAQNFNPLAAMSGRVTIADVEEIVEVGELEGERIDAAGVFVQRVVQAVSAEEPIERRTVREVAA